MVPWFPRLNRWQQGLTIIIEVWTSPGCTHCRCSRTGTASGETRAFAWPSHGWICIRKDQNLEKRNQFNHFNICWLSNKVDTCITFLFGNFLTAILLIWNWKFEQSLLYVFLVSKITSLSPLKRGKNCINCLFYSISVDIRPLLPLQEGSCYSGTRCRPSKVC